MYVRFVSIEYRYIFVIHVHIRFDIFLMIQDICLSYIEVIYRVYFVMYRLYTEYIQVI